MTRCLAGLLCAAIGLLLLSSCVVPSTLFFTEGDIKDSPNLVANPSFSPYSIEPELALKHWAVHLEQLKLQASPPAEESNVGAAAQSPVIIDPKEAFEGNTSLRIDASNQSVMIISDPFTIRRYGGYYLRTMVKTNSPTPPAVTLRFIAFKENGKIVNRFRHKLIPTFEWMRNTISAGFIRPKAKFGRMAIMIPPFKEGSIWIDSAGCYEVHGFKID